MRDTPALLPTSGAVLDFWIGAATDDHLFASRQQKLWFGKSAATDAVITKHFSTLHTALMSGLADKWAVQGARSRLAAIIVLDQFSRNMFRDTPQAFAADPMALRLAKAGLEAGEDQTLTEIERSFFYLPFEHSEVLADQCASVQLYERLVAEARPSFKPISDSSLDYAEQHLDVIKRFGRFPHRNAILGWANTIEEAEYLSKPGAGF